MQGKKGVSTHIFWRKLDIFWRILACLEYWQKLEIRFKYILERLSGLLNAPWCDGIDCTKNISWMMCPITCAKSGKFLMCIRIIDFIV